MLNKIKESLSTYLEFDSDKLFKHCDLIRIFGGAIRDSINGDPINDVDILIGSKSIQIMHILLGMQGYTYMESLVPKDLASCYNDINIINEPETWMKGTKIIQLIKPATANNKLYDKSYHKSGKSLPDYSYKAGFITLIQNVDISCCAVSYDGQNLYENYENAIQHILNKVFIINEKAKMYSGRRISHRIEKFNKRGWEKIKNGDIPQIRNIKINDILEDDNSKQFTFIKEYTNNNKFKYNMERGIWEFDDYIL